jgi:hypothetical protein
MPGVHYQMNSVPPFLHVSRRLANSFEEQIRLSKALDDARDGVA